MKNERYLIDQIKPQESWRVFRIMAEFVDGIETLSSLEPAVTIFGSARSKPGDKYYAMVYTSYLESRFLLYRFKIPPCTA